MSLVFDRSAFSVPGQPTTPFSPFDSTSTCYLRERAEDLARDVHLAPDEGIVRERLVPASPELETRGIHGIGLPASPFRRCSAVSDRCTFESSTGVGRLSSGFAPDAPIRWSSSP
jgi:hypothetical protein